MFASTSAMTSARCVNSARTTYACMCVVCAASYCGIATLRQSRKAASPTASMSLLRALLPSSQLTSAPSGFERRSEPAARDCKHVCTSEPHQRRRTRGETSAQIGRHHEVVAVSLDAGCRAAAATHWAHDLQRQSTCPSRPASCHRADDLPTTCTANGRSVVVIMPFVSSECMLAM